MAGDMAGDMFAPPTADELKSSAMFAPPTADELKSVTPQSAGLLSQIGSAAKDASEGLNQITETVDAPFRKTVGGLLDTAFPRQAKNTSPIDPNEPPSWTDIAAKLGVSADPRNKVSSILPEFYGEHGILGAKGGALDPTPAELIAAPLSLAAPSNLIASTVAPVVRGVGKVAEAIEPVSEAAGKAIGNFSSKLFNRSVRLGDILDSLKDAKNVAGTTPEDVRQIDSLIDVVRGPGKDGKASVPRMHQIIGALEGHLDNPGVTDNSLTAAANASDTAKKALQKHLDDVKALAKKIGGKATEYLSPSGIGAGLLEGGVHHLLPEGGFIGSAIKPLAELGLLKYGPDVAQSMMSKASGALQNPLIKRAVQGNNALSTSGLLK